MGGHAHAGGEQLRAGGGDHQFPIAPLHREGDVVVVAGGGAVLHLGLGHRGAEVHVPHGGRLGGVQVTLAVQVQEAVLGQVAAGVVDGGVLLVPVHRQADSLPHPLKRPLVLARHLRAQLDEVAPRHGARRRLEGLARRHRQLQARLVGVVRIAAHVEVVLHPPLGGQAVVVPPHGVEHLFTEHALVAGDHVGLGVAEHVADVQRPGHRGRRRVHHERLLAAVVGIVAVHAGLLPPAAEVLLAAGGVVVPGQCSGIEGHWSD